MFQIHKHCETENDSQLLFNITLLSTIIQTHNYPNTLMHLTHYSNSDVQ